MIARSLITLPLAVLVALAAPAHFTSVAEAVGLTGESSTDVGPAKQIAEIQARLTAVTGVIEPKATAVEALAQSLMTVRGVTDDGAVIADLAAVVADVLARGGLAPYELERFAQGLFAASRNESLPAPDAGLLAVEIAVLLQEAGAGKDAIMDALGAVQRMQPAATLPPSGIPARPTSRRLSVLSR